MTYKIHISKRRWKCWYGLERLLKLEQERRNKIKEQKDES